MLVKLDIPNPHIGDGQIFSIPAYRQLSAGPCNSTMDVLTAMLFQPLSPFNKYYYKVPVIMIEKPDIPNPHKGIGRIFSIPPYRQLSAGPSNSSMDVLMAMLFQNLTLTNIHYHKLIDDIQQMLRYVFQTNNPLTVVVQVSGNGGNETMVTNLADPGETIIVASSGVWGDKVADMGRRYDLNVVQLTSDPGEVYTFEELEEQIIKHKPVALFVTQGESSGGVLQPLDGLGDICHKYDCLLAVDAVVSLGVVPLLVDKWKIDAVSAGSQKGLGAPAGMAPLTFSPRAHKRMLEKKHPPPYTFDMLSLADAWKCFDRPYKYHYTYGTPMLAAVRQALIQICEEGLENVWARHKKCSDLFISKLDKLGMRHFVKKQENRFAGVNCVVLPSDVKWPLLLDYLLNKHEIEFGFGIGPTADKALRIGFMAQNAKPAIVEYFVAALEDGIKYCRLNGKSSENKFSINV